MWPKIRNMIVPMLLNENALRGLCGAAGLRDEISNAVAKSIMDIKYFIDTKDKCYINLAIDELQKLIK